MKQILVFFLMLSSVLCIKHASAQDFSSLKPMGKAEIKEVISPNTVQLSDGTLIRLAGIYFPDYSVDEAGEFSVTALEILKNMLYGRSVEIFQTKDKSLGRVNRMGHQIAHLRRTDNAMWVQGALLSLGLAQVKTSQRNPEMASDMLALEEEARKEKLGIWAGGDLILSPESAEEHIGEFAIVEGKIHNVSTKKNRLYMNFGGNWREDFTISIAPKDIRRFAAANMDPLKWSGKFVRVRGYIEEYNGPLIEVNHPQALEVLSESP